MLWALVGAGLMGSTMAQQDERQRHDEALTLKAAVVVAVLMGIVGCLAYSATWRLTLRSRCKALAEAVIRITMLTIIIGQRSRSEVSKHGSRVALATLYCVIAVQATTQCIAIWCHLAMLFLLAKWHDK